MTALHPDEAALLTAGADAWTTHPVARLGIVAMKLTDGPNGARGSGGPGAPPAACFPVGTALAATWDVDLVAQVARALGREARDRAAHVLLAPTLNLHRSPLAGRNFECFSEDPHLAARMAVAVVRGVQAEGVAACAKHFVANDSEYERYTLDAQVPARALRELYLVPFEAAVREAGVWTLMTAYNRLQGTSCSAHGWLIGALLKGEWGFDGLVVSDWGGTYDTVGPAVAGLDLEMPGPGHHFGARLAAAVAAGEVPAAMVEDKARRLVRLALRTGAAERPADAPERPGDGARVRALARRAASSSMVLLRNVDDALPLRLEAGQRLAVVGPNAAVATLMGGGSSQVRSYPPVHPLAALRARLEPAGVVVRHEPGCRADRFALPLEPVDGFELWVEPAEGPPVPLGRVARVELGALPFDGPDVRAGTVLRWRGRYVASADGDHELGMVVAGRAQLRLDGELVLDLAEVRSGPTFYGFGADEARAGRALVAGRGYDVEVTYAAGRHQLVTGLRVGIDPPERRDLFERAVGLARDADAAIVVVGLDADWEGEGADRTGFDLPGRQAELIEAVTATCRRTIVVVNAGSPVRLDWAERTSAVLYAWYPGMEAGNALADVLLGDVDPGGRLPTTFPRRLEDTPSFLDYPGESGRVRYAEGVFVGYWGYDGRDVDPLHAFGFGLSYTTFAYGPLVVERLPTASVAGLIEPGGPHDGPGLAPGQAATVVVSVTVTNTGDRPGDEVVQLYVGDRAASVARPPKELAAFAKVHLAPGETTTVRLALGRRAFAFWDEAAGAFRIEPGAFELLVGSSSRHLPARALVELS